MKMVEVFKTNVAEAAHAERLIALLQRHFPGGRITFDLEDCDKVLRVEHADITTQEVITLLRGNEYECSVLQ